MSTRNLFRAHVPWDELHQEAFAAGFAVLVLGAKVHASGGILENKPWPPGLARQSPVTARLEKLQFELQHIQQVAIILWHKLTLGTSLAPRSKATPPPAPQLQ